MVAGAQQLQVGELDRPFMLARTAFLGDAPAQPGAAGDEGYRNLDPAGAGLDHRDRRQRAHQLGVFQRLQPALRLPLIGGGIAQDGQHGALGMVGDMDGFAGGALVLQLKPQPLRQPVQRRGRGSRLPVQQFQHAAQRNADPVRPVRQLVPDLVQRLLEQEQPQQRVGMRGVLRIPRRPWDGGLVSLHEGVGDGGRPFLRPLRLGRSRRIGERPQHARDVPQRRMLRPPLRQRTHRLALEIDDEEVAARHQHLTQMVVAMQPRPADIQPLGSQIVEPPDQLLTPRQQAFGLRPHFGVKPGQRPLQRIQRLARHGPHRLDPLVDDGLRDMLRPESRIVRRGRQRMVHLGRPLAQLADQRQQLRIGRRPGPLQHIAPGVFRLGNQRLNDAQRRGPAAVFIDPLDRPQQCGGVGEARHLGQEAPDLQFGVGALFQLAEALQHGLPADADRGVGLLRPRPLDRVDLAQIPAAPPEPQPAGLPPFPHALDQGGDEGVAGERVDQHTLPHLRQNGGIAGIRLRVPHDRERQEVALLGASGRADQQRGQQDRPLGRIQHRLVEQRHGRSARILGAVPAVPHQVGRKHPPLQDIQRVAAKRGQVGEVGEIDDLSGSGGRRHGEHPWYELCPANPCNPPLVPVDPLKGEAFDLAANHYPFVAIDLRPLALECAGMADPSVSPGCGRLL